MGDKKPIPFDYFVQKYCGAICRVAKPQPRFQAMVVLNALASCNGPKGICPSEKRLTIYTGFSARAISEAKRQLRGAKYKAVPLLESDRRGSMPNLYKLPGVRAIYQDAQNNPDQFFADTQKIRESKDSSIREQPANQNGLDTQKTRESKDGFDSRKTCNSIRRKSANNDLYDLGQSASRSVSEDLVKNKTLSPEPSDSERRSVCPSGQSETAHSHQNDLNTVTPPVNSEVSEDRLKTGKADNCKADPALSSPPETTRVKTSPERSKTKRKRHKIDKSKFVTVKQIQDAIEKKSASDDSPRRSRQPDGSNGRIRPRSIAQAIKMVLPESDVPCRRLIESRATSIGISPQRFIKGFEGQSEQSILEQLGGQS
jgi:hypothetical protein